MRARRFVPGMVIGLMAVGMTACGPAPGPARAPGQAGAPAAGAAASSPVIVTVPAVPTASTAPAGRIVTGRQTLTVARNGATVRLRAGQLVAVALVSHGLVWDVPKSSGDALRRISVSGGYPTGRPARAEFRAVRRGMASVTSVTDAKCLHSRPRCGLVQRLWRVVVIVTNR